jgi:hypothetical protein
LNQRASLISGGRVLSRVQAPMDTVAPNGLVQTVSANLSADISSSVSSPTYSTLLTVPITTTLVASVLDILFYCAFDFTVVGFVDRAVAFRLRLDGVLVPPSRAATDNAPTAINMCVAINRRVSVAAGAHTVLVEWTKFGTGTLQCFPATRPDRHGAHLLVEEQRT